MARLIIVVALVVGLVGACDRADVRPVDWNRKDAWRRCGEAIRAYPRGPLPPCSALHMCANEAVLGPAEYGQLEAMIAAGRCAPL